MVFKMHAYVHSCDKIESCVQIYQWNNWLIYVVDCLWNGRNSSRQVSIETKYFDIIGKSRDYV